MKKTIVVGDIHGREDWKKISNQKFDKFVFIGDYLDTHDNISGEKQLENFKDIIQLKKDYPEQIILLIGNHDYHYMSFLNVNEHYSGFQSGMQYIFNDILKDNIHLFQMCYKIDENYLCSHAGVSKTWLKSTSNAGTGEDTVENHINEVFKYQPKYFKFNGRDPYGDDITQSPIWIRPESLLEDGLEGFIHIVGHTTVENINLPKGDSNMILIDTLGTSKEYLIIENNEIIIKKYE